MSETLMFKPTLFVLAALAVTAQAQVVSRQTNPFLPPNASIHYAPDRTCDLMNITVDLDVDYPTRTFTGHAVNTMSALRSGIDTVVLQAGPTLTISRVTVDDKAAPYTRDGRNLNIKTGVLKRGQVIKIAIDYKDSHTKAGAFGQQGGGFHWIEPREGTDTHVGFWTQGEAEFNSNWAPTWDHPNDLTTSETRCTVQADWDVIGNGTLISNKKSADGKKRTFVWRMTQPHATYLLTLCGGPFDIKRDKWEGVDLLYVVPRGMGDLIDDTFGDTKDMLTFYSKILGVKYAWPKYAQDAMYDFGGGMENVSATTLGDGELTDKREGFRNAASINSHELGHQWFGDLVTCNDWGDTWLNESFATIMQILYFEHSRGKTGYDQEIEGAMRSYFAEARRYTRPISTHMYHDPDQMFDSHTYPKGGVVLHTLRKQLGDEAFFAGLNLYLTRHRHTPVQSWQLCRAMSDASGINCEPFWEQWFLKPGHPVISYDWKYDDASGEIVMNVQQGQDLAYGAPIYDIPTKIGMISGSAMSYAPVRLNAVTQEIRVKAAKPVAVVLDPEHDFLREMRHEFADGELEAILQYSPNAIDREVAMRRILAGTPTATQIQLAVRMLRADDSVAPVFRDIRALAALKDESLRPFFLSQLKNQSFGRQGQAVDALGQLAPNPETTAALRSMVNDKAPIAVVVSAMNVLGNWDAAGNVDTFVAGTKIPSRRERVRSVAYANLVKAKGPKALDAILSGATSTSVPVQVAAIAALGDSEDQDPRIHAALEKALGSSDWNLVSVAAQTAANRKDKALAPAVQAALNRTPPDTVKTRLERILRELSAS